jgi:hypothetical protein
MLLNKLLLPQGGRVRACLFPWNGTEWFVLQQQSTMNSRDGSTLALLCW